MPENKDWGVPENEERDLPEDEEEFAPDEDEDEFGPDEDEDEFGPDGDEDEDEFGPDDEKNDGPEHPRKRVTWKQVLLVAVALVVVGSLIQVILRSGGFGGALSTTGDQGSKKGQTQDVKPPKKPKTVELGNKKIPRSAGAIIVINPGLVAPGARATVEGAGFDAKSTVDLMIKTGKSSKGTVIQTVKADKSGSIFAGFKTPETSNGQPATVVAQQRGGDNVAEAQLISGGGIGMVKINKAAGKPGDTVSLNIRGFGAGETINVYWGRTTGTPVTTLHADGSGGIGRADVKVGVAPTGISSLVLVGTKTKTTATAPFQVLGLYPSVKSSPYALKPGQRIGVSAKGFAPNERVLIYINAAGGIPAFTAQANENGAISDIGFNVPFGLKGPQRLTVIGDQTRAVVRSGFTVLPFTPTAEPSAFGAKPGTTISFYVSGFAPNETVTIYAGGTHDGGGKKIGTFQVDAQGKAKGAGAYKIIDENGVSFRLIGQKSGSTATASVNNQQGQGQGGQGGQGGAGDQGGEGQAP